MTHVFVEALLYNILCVIFLGCSLNHLFSSCSLMSIWLCSRDKIDNKGDGAFAFTDFNYRGEF